MIRDEMKNKIQLKTTNVNKKKIANKRRGTESKEKNNWRVDLIFCMACMQIQEEREGKERERKKKIISDQTVPNHYTGAI